MKEEEDDMYTILAAAETFSIQGMWESMSIFAKAVVIFLLLMSLSSLTVFVERMIVYWQSIRQTRMAAGGLQKSLPEFKWEDAQRACSQYKASHLARVVGAGVADVIRGKDIPGSDRAESAKRSMERMRDREVSRLRRGLGMLATVGSIAPFVGLLGTVVGIVNAFKQIAQTGSGGLASVSAGISEALITTAIGLLVAIPAVMIFNYLSSVVDRLALDMQDAITEFFDFVMKSSLRPAAQPAAPLRQAQG
jgi:biopolymer transport protein ExbB